MKKILFFMMIAFMATSCKDYLDVKPHNRIVPETAEEYSALVHAFLNDVDYNRDNAVLFNTGKLSNYEGFADNLDASLSKSDRALPLYVGKYLNGMQGEYSKLYSHIRTCNIILNDIKKNNPDNKDLAAFCHTLRGICYYNLIRNFCEPFDKNNAENQLGVSIVDKFNLEDRPLRADLKSCAEFIEDDFKRAIELNSVKEEYKLDVDVAKAYLARLYYWTKDWTNAIEVSKELLNNYPLVSGNEYKEMINSMNNKVGNELLEVYTSIDKGTERTYKNIIANIQLRPASKEFVELFEDGDIRFNMFLNEKWLPIKPVLSRIRTAEFCMVIAESYAYLDKPEQSLEYLNLLRRNRISNYREARIKDLLPVDKNYLIKEDAEGNELTPLTYAIITERQKELFLEGDRWFQLKMHGRPEFWIGYEGLKYTTKKYMYTAPINRKDCQLIKGLKQNPGYID